MKTNRDNGRNGGIKNRTGTYPVAGILKKYQRKTVKVAQYCRREKNGELAPPTINCGPAGEASKKERCALAGNDRQTDGHVV